MRTTTTTTTTTTTAIGWLFALTIGLGPARAAEAPPAFDVWPGAAPGETGNVGAETEQEQKPGESVVRRITNVSKPTITLFPAPREANTGAAVLIAPGGGYNILAWDLEGEEVAKWLNSIGVTGVVLKYRVPRRPDQVLDGQPRGALQDAQRAMRLVRSRAGEWGIDPKRIGMLGFSAGGHLTAWASTNFDRPAYEAADDVDKASSRPDFAVLVYPAYLATDDGLKPEIRVTDQTPPTFFVHAGDDKIKAENSVQMYLALRKAGVVGSELHSYAAGGHGFGLRPTTQPSTSWPERCAQWMRATGLLDKKDAGK